MKTSLQRQRWVAPSVALGLSVVALVAGGGAQRLPSPPSMDTCAVVGVGLSPHLLYESDPLDTFVARTGFVVRYDAVRHQPAFTVHELRPEALAADGRPPAVRRSGFRVETIEGGGLTARDADYAGSGYDRGHFVPAGDFVWDQAGKDETFTYFNVAPFNANLNRGAWAVLEGAVRDLVSQTGGAAYIVTGSLFVFPTGTIGPDSLVVPSHFYKLVYHPATDAAYAFLFDNTVIGYAGDLSDFQTTVDFVEAVAGEDFYDRLDDACEGPLERALTPLVGARAVGFR